jgi:hypothetical protein
LVNVNWDASPLGDRADADVVIEDAPGFLMHVLHAAAAERGQHISGLPRDIGNWITRVRHGLTPSRTNRKRTVPGFVPVETASIGGNRATCGWHFCAEKRGKPA